MTVKRILSFLLALMILFTMPLSALADEMGGVTDVSAPAEPAPVELTSAEPTPVEPIPTEPNPTEPVTEPTEAETVPMDPPEEPNPTEPTGEVTQPTQEPTTPAEPTTPDEPAPADPAPAEPTLAEIVQGMLNELPEEVTAENQAAVIAQLETIDDAKLPLGDDFFALDITRYVSAIAALEALEGTPGAQEPQPQGGVTYWIGIGVSVNLDDLDLTGYTRIENQGTITGGTTDLYVINSGGTITGGTFNGSVANGTIYGGTFNGEVSVGNGGIHDGTFNSYVEVIDVSICGGNFHGDVAGEGMFIYGGTFYGNVSTSTFWVIAGGEFEGDIYGETFTVAFDSKGGTSVASQIRFNAPATKPADPTRTDSNGGTYVFVGWYNGGTEYTFTEDVTSNITLTAKWEYVIPAGTSVNLDKVDLSNVTQITNNGTIIGGNSGIPVVNNGMIQDGYFEDSVTNHGTIQNGRYSLVTNSGTIQNGWFYLSVTNSGTIQNGSFYLSVTNNGEIEYCYLSHSAVMDNNGMIYDGLFPGSVKNSATGIVSGGNFEGATLSGVYTVTFDSKGGSAVSTQYRANAPATKPADPTNGEKKFCGWYVKTAQGYEPYDFTANVTADITLYANWDCDLGHTGGTATCAAKAICETCGQSYGELGEDNHTYGALVPAQPEVHTATELKASVDAHYHCACGKYFDENKVETTLEALTGEKPDHSGSDDGDCTTAVECDCGYIMTEAKANHDWSNCDGKCANEGCTATCDSTADENHDHACDTCGKPVTTCADNLTPVNGQTASCKVDGWKDYYTCSICGKKYSDASAQNQITDLDAWKTGEGKIPAAHLYGALVPAQPEVHTKTELKPAVAAHYLCACGKYFDENKVETTLDALTGETPKHSGGEATCKDKAVCEICGAEYGDLNPANHAGEKTWTVKNETQHEQKWSCCGVTVVALEDHEWEHGVCTECGYVCQHSGGSANCQKKAVCEICGEEYGKLNDTIHTGEPVMHKTPTTHEKTWNCCGKVMVAETPHNWYKGVCRDCKYVCQHSGSDDADCNTAVVCEYCGEVLVEAQSHWFSYWKPCSDGYHAAYCIRKGCDGAAGLPCEWFNLTFTTSDEEEMTVSICPVCGAVRHEDIVFEAIKSATVKANEKWLPRGELIVRGMENPYGDCLYAFTVGYEYSGWLEDLLGTVAVTILMEELGEVEKDFRLFYVETDEETQEQILTEVEFTFEDGELIFETEKQGIFLIFPASE